MSAEAQRASAEAGKAITGVGTDVNRFTAETAPELERLLGEMNVLAASLRRLSEKIESSPGGLLLGRRPVPAGPGEGKGP
jgi:phospholipid/cholesterol/gamma-HCH transport system substrate-binding protein